MQIIWIYVTLGRVPGSNHAKQYSFANGKVAYTHRSYGSRSCSRRDNLIPSVDRIGDYSSSSLPTLLVTTHTQVQSMERGLISSSFETM
jgi:hypothetical protein